ncbi:MAG: tetratricopeptide repeat protein, partial [Candidatus Heimdallarchaeota archaeon]|nr:tetratricopeptide repeat protein [Candidatus Heimdallarchaeota archaeon]
MNRRSINLSKELKDSVSLAANYWDLGIFFARNEIKDSAYFNYFKAQKIYESINNNFYSGRLLLNMAIIQTDLKDYTGSEITTFKALELLKPLDKYDQLYRCYNNLGIIYNELEDFEQSLIYHNEALGYEKKIKESNTFKANTLNNIGVVYERQKNLREALKNYQLAIAEQNLKNKNSELFARILGNIAYSKFLLRDTSGIKNIFYKALRIRDSVNDLSGISINKIQLAEYYSFNKDTLQAIKLAKEASDLSFRTNNFRDQLASFLLLSKLDKKNSSHYANKYIVLSDKLVKQERSVRNKFARIQFETDEYISENERLYEQRKRLLMLSFAGLILAILSYIIIDQRHKNIKLRLEARQQKANEEIYDLMLVQQYKLDEGRRKEKKRISEELHDGVLGKLFGTRLLLSALNDKSDAKNIKKREKYIIDLQAVEEEVRSVSHELSRQSEFLNVGYKQVVQDLLENQSKISSFNYEFRCDKKINWEEISGEFKMNMYRIIQESLQNINKYAKAKNVMVEFKLTQKHLKLLIIDDGIGFNTSIKKKGIGLKNIKSRTKHLKGIFKIKSESSSGTFIEIKIPYLGDLIF